MKFKSIFPILVFLCPLMTNAQQDVIVRYENPIVLDTLQGDSSGDIIMSGELSSKSLDTWIFQAFKIQDSIKISTPDSLRISVYELKNIDLYADDILLLHLDSMPENQSMFPIAIEFAAGTIVKIKARFPEGKTGLLNLKMMFSFKDRNYPVYERFDFIQEVYRGIQPDTTSSSVSNLTLDNIILCQNMIGRTIIFKNIRTESTLKVYDVRGKMVLEKQHGRFEEEIDFKELPVGFYFISIGDFYKKIAI